MSPEQRRALWRVLQLVLLVVAVWGIYRALADDLGRLSWSDVTRWRPDLWVLTLSFVLLLLVYLAHALLWRVILRDLRIGNPSLRATIRTYFLAGLGRYIPGRLWVLAGFAMLAKRAGLPPVAATAAQVLGQFAFLTTGILFLAITLPNWDQALGDAAVTGLKVIAVVLVGAAVVLWALLATPLGHRFREALIARLGARAGERLKAAFRLADQVTVGNGIKWVVGYGLSWVVLGATFALFAIAFVPEAAGSARFLGGAVAASYLAGYIFVVAPAGVGVREAGMYVLLEQVMPQGAALVVSILSRVWFTAGELMPLALLPVLPARAGEEAA